MPSSTLSARREHRTTEQGLVLRVQGSRHHGRLIRLTASRTTIGSAEDCSLRLVAPGVGPCHCEILRRADGVRVRCLGEDTRLNGEPFDEVPLSPHDRLSIGPIELEVVQADPLHPAPATASRPNRLRANPGPDDWSGPLSRRPALQEAELWRQLQQRSEQLATREAKLNAAWHRLEEERRQYMRQQEADGLHHQDPTDDIEVRLAELETRRTELDQQHRQWETERSESEEALQRRTTELEARLSELQSERDRLEEERRQWEQDRAAREEAIAADAERFQTQRDDLEAKQAELDQQHRQWETERSESEEALQRRTAELEARLSELQSERDRLEEQRQQWEQRYLARGSELAADAERFEAKWADLETQRAEFDQQRRQWETERAELEESLQRRKDDVTAQFAELQANQTLLEQQRRQWEEDRAALDRRMRGQAAQPAASFDGLSTADEELSAADTGSLAADNSPADEADPSASDAPVDLDTVLARMGNLGLLRDEDRADASPAAQGDTADRQLPQETPNAPASEVKEGDGEDESIQRYMAQLMQRIRGEKSTGDVDEPTGRGTQPHPVEASTPAEGLETAETEPVESDQEAKAQPTGEIAPRAVAPEKVSGLSAMRELANLSARTAISRHSVQRMKDATATKFIMAGVALVCGLVLLWKWQDWGGQAWTYYSALAALLTALICAIHGALLTGRLYVDKSGHLDWQTQPAEDEPEK